MSTDGQELYQVGFEQGREWAARGNVQRALRRLRRYKEEIPPYEWNLHFQDAGAGLRVAWTMEPNLRDDANAARDYWKEAAGNRNSDIWEPEYVLGFVEGALGIERQPLTETEDAGEVLPSDASASGEAPSDEEPAGHSSQPPVRERVIDINPSKLPPSE